MTDALAKKYQVVSDLRSTYRNEVERRYGPGAPSRLPKGFGPIKQSNPEFSTFTLLCSNEDGNQLFVVGGDQSIPLSAFGISGPMAEKELITIGEVWGLNYRTRKTFDGEPDENDIDYIHILGKKETKPARGGDLWEDAVPPPDKTFGTGEFPTLIYDRANKKIRLSGGMYQIKKPFIGTSPGIEH